MSDNSDTEPKIRLDARVPGSLYNWVCATYKNKSEAVIDGLEMLKAARDGDMPGDRVDNQLAVWDELVTYLAEHIDSQREQLRVKDDQLQRQSVHIQSLIQENTRLLPEPKPDKAWWQIWKH